MINLYFFGWPGFVGGASTRLWHLLELLAETKRYRIRVIANNKEEMNVSRKDWCWKNWLNDRSISYMEWDGSKNWLLLQENGYAISLCNEFFLREQLEPLRKAGFKIVWSNEMMWFHARELEHLAAGRIDHYLYVSNTQRSVLSPIVDKVICSGNGIKYESDCREYTIGNYINPVYFPYVDRTFNKNCVTIGRCSRPDPLKFPDDFPEFYESLAVPARFAVMGWDAQMGKKYAGHYFDHRWTFYPQGSLDTHTFYGCLDFYVFNTGTRFRESWGRSVIEAMLTGCIPFLDFGPGHGYEEILWDKDDRTFRERGIFPCHNWWDYSTWLQLLTENESERKRLSLAARATALKICDKQKQLKAWEEIFI